MENNKQNNISNEQGSKPFAQTTHPFKVVGEITIWQGHPAEQVKAMKDALEKLKEQGVNSLND